MNKYQRTFIKRHYKSLFKLNLIVLILLLPQILPAQCYQEEYKTVISLAKEDLQTRNYQRAINRLLDAQYICPDEAEAINDLIKRTFFLIEGEKQAAIIAQQQTEKEKRRADSTLAVANKVLDQMIFYRNKFGLTLKRVQKGKSYDDYYSRNSSSHLYGYIDRKGNEVLPFEYEEATPFSETDGFARVTKNEKKYLLDTLGRTYLLAENLSELTKETEALDIHELKPDIFPDILEDFSELKVILAYGGKIETLPESFKQFTQLEVCNLSYNQFEQFPEALTQLPNLKILNLRDNPISNLPPSIGQLQKLEVLNLHSHKLDRLPENIGQLKQLRWLNIWGDQSGFDSNLKTLPKSFALLTNLERLEIANTDMETLPESFGQLTKLKYLSLFQNDFKTLPECVCELNQLQYLGAGFNDLTSLPNCIGNLNRLVDFSAHSNELSSLPEEIGLLRQLREFYLSENQLRNLPESIGQLNKLQLLSLGDNQLSDLPKTFGQLIQLESLYLGGNQLQNLPETIGNLKRLKNLSLNENRLSNLPIVIAQLKELSYLHLSSNQLNSLPPEISHLQKLETLILGKNPFIIFPESLAQLKNLKILDLHKCLLDSISEKDFRQFHSLEALYLGHDGYRYGYTRDDTVLNNKISKIPSSIGKLTNLNFLDLSRNQLAKVPKEIGKLSKLKVLNLDGNKLQNLPIEIDQLENLTKLNLNANPFRWDSLANLVTDSIKFNAILDTLLLEHRSIKETQLLLENLNLASKSYWDKGQSKYASKISQARILFAERAMETYSKDGKIREAMINAYSDLAFYYLSNHSPQKAKDFVQKAGKLINRPKSVDSLMRDTYIRVLGSPSIDSIYLEEIIAILNGENLNAGEVHYLMDELNKKSIFLFQEEKGNYAIRLVETSLSLGKKVAGDSNEQERIRETMITNYSNLASFYLKNQLFQKSDSVIQQATKLTKNPESKDSLKKAIYIETILDSNIDTTGFDTTVNRLLKENMSREETLNLLSKLNNTSTNYFDNGWWDNSRYTYSFKFRKAHVLFAEEAVKDPTKQKEILPLLINSYVDLSHQYLANKQIQKAEDILQKAGNLINSPKSVDSLRQKIFLKGLSSDHSADIDTTSFDKIVENLYNSNLDAKRIHYLVEKLNEESMRIFDREDYKYAVKVAKTSISFGEKVLSDSTEQEIARANMAISYSNLAAFYLYNQLFQKSDSMFDVAMTLIKEPKQRDSLKKSIYIKAISGNNIDSTSFNYIVNLLLKENTTITETQSLLNKLGSGSDDYFDRDKNYQQALKFRETIVLFMEQAMKDIDKWEEMQLNITNAYTNLAYTYLYNRLFVKAEEAAKKALKLEPKGYGNTSLIRAYVLQGRLEEAKAHFGKIKDKPIPGQSENFAEALIRQLNSMEEAGVFQADNKYVREFRSFLAEQGE